MKTVSYLKALCTSVIHCFEVTNIFMYSLLYFNVAEAKYAIVRPENRALCENDTFHSENEDVIETLPKTSEKVQDFSRPAFLSVEPLLKASHMSLEVIGLPKVSYFVILTVFFPRDFSHTIPLILL